MDRISSTPESRFSQEKPNTTTSVPKRTLSALQLGRFWTHYKKDNLVSTELQAGFQNALVESAHKRNHFLGVRRHLTDCQVIGLARSPRNRPLHLMHTAAHLPLTLGGQATIYGHPWVVRAESFLVGSLQLPPKIQWPATIGWCPTAHT